MPVDVASRATWWMTCAGLISAFGVGALFTYVDLFITLSKSELRTKNMLNSVAIVAFILLSGAIAAAVEAFSIAYPGTWVTRAIGFDVENIPLRGVVLGCTITAISRSRLFNLSETKGLGFDAIYASLRTMAIRSLHVNSILRMRHLSEKKATEVTGCPDYNEKQFLLHVSEFVNETLDSMYADESPRREALKKSFNKLTAPLSNPDPQSIVDLTPSHAMIKFAMQYCGIGTILKDVDHWMSTKGHVVERPWYRFWAA